MSKYPSAEDVAKTVEAYHDLFKFLTKEYHRIYVVNKSGSSVQCFIGNNTNQVRGSDATYTIESGAGDVWERDSCWEFVVFIKGSDRVGHYWKLDTTQVIEYHALDDIRIAYRL